MMFEALFGMKTGGRISPRDAKHRLSSGDKVYLLDVRTPEEYKEIHISNSISLPLNQLKSGIAKITKEKDAEILVYCLSGMRASQACQLLASMGYTNVKNLGGIQSWPYETERGEDV